MKMLKNLLCAMSLMVTCTTSCMLQEAVKQGDMQKVETLLKTGVDTYDALTALTLATQQATEPGISDEDQEKYEKMVNGIMIYADNETLQNFPQESINLLSDNRKNFITWLKKGAIAKDLPAKEIATFSFLMLGMPNIAFNNFADLLSHLEPLVLAKIISSVVQRYDTTRVNKEYLTMVTSYLLQQLKEEDAREFLTLLQPDQTQAQEFLNAFIENPSFENPLLNSIEKIYLYALHHNIKLADRILGFIVDLVKIKEEPIMIEESVPSEEMTKVFRPIQFKPHIVQPTQQTTVSPSILEQSQTTSQQQIPVRIIKQDPVTGKVRAKITGPLALTQPTSEPKTQQKTPKATQQESKKRERKPKTKPKKKQKRDESDSEWTPEGSK